MKFFIFTKIKIVTNIARGPFYEIKDRELLSDPVNMFSKWQHDVFSLQKFILANSYWIGICEICENFYINQIGTGYTFAIGYSHNTTCHWDQFDQEIPYNNPSLYIMDTWVQNSCSVIQRCPLCGGYFIQ